MAEAAKPQLTPLVPARPLPAGHLHAAEAPRPLRISTLTVTGLECSDCAMGLHRAIAALPGVVEVDLVFSTARLEVAFRPERTGESAILAALDRLGYGAKSVHALTQGARAEYVLRGLDCADCACHLEDRLLAVPGVRQARVNFGAATLEVVFEDAAKRPDVSGAAASLGYEVVERKVRSTWQAWRTRRKAIATGVSGVALGLGLALSALAHRLSAPSQGGAGWLAGGLGADVLFALAIVAGGMYMSRAALAAWRSSQGLDINFLMSVAVIGALFLGHWEEAAEVVFLFAAGNALAAETMDRTRSALRALLQLAPPLATVREGSREVRRALEDVAIGATVIVRPGERIPVDGKVLEGSSTADQAALTGESELVAKSAGDPVLAGTLNGCGALVVRADRRADDSAMARIVKLVEDAQRQRAPIQQIVDRFAAVYTPAVVGLAGVLVLLPALLQWPDAPRWAYQAIALLVVSCPCALVVSTPVAIAAAIASASRKGLLIKGGAFLEALGHADCVAFDKTGTLTRGQPVVTDLVTTDGLAPADLLTVAAALEHRSEHPFAEAIVRKHHQLLHDGGEHGQDQACSHSEQAAGHEAMHEAEHGTAGACGHGDQPLVVVENFVAIPGRGVVGTLAGREVCVGNSPFMADRGISVLALGDRLEAWRQEGKTPILVGGSDRLLGGLALADEPRPEAPGALTALRQAGIDHIAILTGDHQTVADPLARRLGVNEVLGDLLPEGKVGAVRNLLARHKRVVMVGDGINDAPALATATVGVAMGARGTAVAVETADVALMHDDLRLLARAVHLGRETMAVIGQNIAFALAVKVALVSLAVAHVLTLRVAVLGDVGTTLLVIFNSMRLQDAAALRDRLPVRVIAGRDPDLRTPNDPVNRSRSET